MCIIEEQTVPPKEQLQKKLFYTQPPVKPLLQTITKLTAHQVERTTTNSTNGVLLFYQEHLGHLNRYLVEEEK